jgi:murein DD-endopeptidase MepM/ murein hydrolase activator NlpD
MVPGQFMPVEKPRILSELSMLRGNRRLHGLLMGGATAASLLSVVTSFAYTSMTSQPRAETVTIVEQLTGPDPIVAGITNSIYSREDRLRPGESFAGLMRRLGIYDQQANAFLRNHPAGKALLTRLRAGQTVSASFDERGELRTLTYPLPGMDRAVVLDRSGNDLSVTEKPLALEKRIQMLSGRIQSSLFAAADEVGLPDSVAVQLAEIFGAEIDFHSDLRRGDRFSVIYEAYSLNGQDVKAGQILAAEFVNHGVTRRAIWYEGERGSSGYYTADGQSLKKAFLRSPLEYSRISSGFSMRFHPILRDWRAHKGVDYAAPLGTSVLATADGTVEFIGQQRGYGNFVVLRHHDQYTTAYGHLNSFASGLQQGSRVEQGQVIGYVGRTGWATGPHLHYEFRIADVHQDPLSADLPISIPLSPVQLAAFRSMSAPLLARIALQGQTSLALRD